MAQVASLADYRARREAQAPPRPSPETPAPRIDDGEILSRDYTRTPDIVFGLLKIREILGYHLFYDEAWKGLLLDLLDAACRPGDEQTGRLARAALNLKDHIVEEMVPDSYHDLSAALLITDLVEKTPAYKNG
jgi:hypothetical protein